MAADFELRSCSHVAGLLLPRPGPSPTMLAFHQLALVTLSCCYTVNSNNRLLYGTPKVLAQEGLVLSSQGAQGARGWCGGAEWVGGHESAAAAAAAAANVQSAPVPLSLQGKERVGRVAVNCSKQAVPLSHALWRDTATCMALPHVSD